MVGRLRIMVESVNSRGTRHAVDAEKYTAMRLAILNVLPEKPPGFTFPELMDALRPLLPHLLWPGGEKAMWWAKTVQLDLEARDEIKRTPGKPPHWYKGKE
jgi:hypothetical protein